MNWSPKDNRNMSKPELSKSSSKVAKKRATIHRIILLSLPLVVLMFFAGVALHIINLPAGSAISSVQEKPISEILNMADQHKLVSVVVSGNDVTATDKKGVQYHAIKEDGQSVTEILRHEGVAISVDSTQSGQWVQGVAELFLIVAVVGAMYFLMRRSGGGGQAMPFARSKAKRFNESRPSVLFKDVAGVEEAKTELQEIVEFLRYPERFTAMGARTPKGVLLVGEPGTGKTLISRAVAGEAGVPFYSVSGSEFVEMFVGVGAARVRDLFKQAKEHAPCIIFIDEIDAIGRQRSNSGASGNDEREQTLNQLLVEMDGFDKQTSIVVIAATNRPDILDSALLRPGRFDRRVMLDKPDIRGRLAILKVHGENKPLAPDVQLEDLARQTSGFSGADLANLLNEAALLAARDGLSQIEKSHLDEATLRVVAGPERKSRIISEAEKAIIAYHEVGHAIVMRSMPNSDPVQKVTAIARGMALGITVQAPAEDRYLLRRSELMAKMAGAMGGRAAEEVIFGDITTGASQDIEYVTRLARRMVCEFGMSPLGTIALKADAEGSYQVGAALASKIDAEISTLIDQSYATALRILREKQNKLIAISEHLMQVETIDGSELDRMLFAA